MNFIVFLFSVIVFLKTAGYGYYEYKKQNNKITGSVIILLSVICLVSLNILPLLGRHY